MAFIYKLTDKRNGNMYVGKSKRNSTSSYFSGGKIVNDIVKKFGKDIFEREIIIEGDLTHDELSAAEIFYISWFNTYEDDRHYNLTKGGDDTAKFGKVNGMYGKTHTKEARDKIRKKRKKLFEVGLLTTVKGKKWSKDAKGRKIHSERMKQRRENGEFYQIGEANHMYGKVPYNARKILQYDLDGNFIKEYISATDASKELNMKSHKSISNAAYGNYNSSAGFLWIYKDEFSEELLKQKIDKFKERSFFARGKNYKHAS